VKNLEKWGKTLMVG